MFEHNLSDSNWLTDRLGPERHLDLDELFQGLHAEENVEQPGTQNNDLQSAGETNQTRSILREYPYHKKNPESKIKLTKEVPAPPEFPGHPYSDEVDGNLILGPEYPAIKKILDDPDATFEEKQFASNQKSRLAREAFANEAWHYGPLNERATMTVKTKLSISKFEKPDIDPNQGSGDDEAGSDPAGGTDPISEPGSPLPDLDKGNKFTKWVKKITKKITKDMKGFDEYLTRNRDEMHDLAAYAGIAGIVSVSGAALAAEVALAIAAPPLLVPLAAIAAGGLINYFGFTKNVSKWANEKYDKTISSRDVEDTNDYKEFIEKAKSDKKYRLRTFAWADIVAKIAGGIGLGMSMHQSDPGEGFKGSKSTTHVDGSPADHADNMPLGAEPTTVIPVEVTPPHFVEHVVTSPDEMLTQIVRDNLPATENVYSENYIKVLQANESTFIKMLQNMYPNGHVPHLIDSNTHEWEYWTLQHAIDNLKQVNAIGDPTLLPPEQQAEAVDNMLQAIRDIAPGTVIKIPQP